MAVDGGSAGSVLLHVPSGRYLKLDRPAMEIVALLATAEEPAAAARALAERRQLPIERAAADVASVVEAFSTLGIARPAGPRRVHAPGVRSALRGWMSLPWRDRIGTAYTAALLCAVELGLRRTDIRRLARWLRAPLSDGGHLPARNGDVQLLSPNERRTLQWVEWILARWLYPGTCLRRALLTGYFLKARRPSLRLGLMADGETAHAWVEVDGRAYWATEDLIPFSRVG